MAATVSSGCRPSAPAFPLAATPPRRRSSPASTAATPRLASSPIRSLLASSSRSATALGRLTGVGTDISFSNPDAKPGYVHQFSVDWQKEFAGRQRRSASATWAAGPNASAWVRRRTRRSTSTSSIRKYHVARHAAESVGAESVLRDSRVRRHRARPGDDHARPAAAAVSAVPERHDDAQQRGAGAVPRGRHALEQADGDTVTRSTSATRGATPRTTRWARATASRVPAACSTTTTSNRNSARRSRTSSIA